MPNMIAVIAMALAVALSFISTPTLANTIYGCDYHKNITCANGIGTFSYVDVAAAFRKGALNEVYANFARATCRGCGSKLNYTANPGGDDDTTNCWQTDVVDRSDEPQIHVAAVFNTELNAYAWCSAQASQDTDAECSCT